MSDVHLAYFEKEDILHLAFSDEPEADSVEIQPGVTAEFNAEGELIGYEILNGTEFVREAVLSKVTASREAADRRDLEILNRLADTLNAEAEDVLGYQELP